MSFYHVQPLLKKTKKVILSQGPDMHQWVGDGYAYYRLYDMPSLVNFDNLFDLMSVDETVRERYFTMEKILPDVDLERSGEPVSWGIPFLYGDDLYQVIYTEDDAICILEEYLKPLRFLKRREYHIEYVGFMPYLVVHVGRTVFAILGGDPISADVVERLQKTVDILRQIAKPSEPTLFDEREEYE